MKGLADIERDNLITTIRDLKDDVRKQQRLKSYAETELAVVHDKIALANKELDELTLLAEEGNKMFGEAIEHAKKLREAGGAEMEES